jgi:hypothetical protein
MLMRVCIMEHPARLERKEVGVGVVEGESLGVTSHP